jgi:hypothetical protein
MKSQTSKDEADWLECIEIVRDMLKQMKSAAPMHRSVQTALLKRWSETLEVLSRFHEKP